MVGLDADAFGYESDALQNFELEDGEFLEGQALVDHLLQNNDILKDKVKALHQKCSKKSDCYKNLDRVRSFNKNILYGSSRGALTLKLSLDKKVA